MPGIFEPRPNLVMRQFNPVVKAEAEGADSNRVAFYAHGTATVAAIIRSDEDVAILATGKKHSADLTGDLQLKGDALFDGSLRVTGSVDVKGDVTLHNADCAEFFSTCCELPVEAGSVMVIGEGGRISQCCSPYDRCVAGVTSGAGDFRPAIFLDREQKDAGGLPLALVGKVFCKVDASFASIEIGDLLTTSPTIGCAMKASDMSRAFGAVLGKALAPLQRGTGHIPILVTLQ